MNRKALKDINETHVRVQQSGVLKSDEIAENNNCDENMYQLRSTRSRTQAMKLKREAPVEEERPVKRLKSDVSSSSSNKTEASNDSDDTSAFIEYVKQVLGKHYLDVADRLKLDATPECVMNLNRCIQNHGPGQKTLPECDEYLTKEVSAFIDDGNIDTFIRQLFAIVMKGEFPGETQLQLMLEIMLSFNGTRHPELIEEVLESGEILFTQVLKTFTPCWTNVRDKYLSLLTNDLQMNNFKGRNEIGKDTGLFNLLLTQLDHNIRNDEKNKEEPILTDSLDMNFHKWEEHDKPTFDFDKNPREDRLQRIFCVLSLVVDLLEHDLAVWILKNPRNGRKGFIKYEKKPLVAALFWKERGCEINIVVKQIMKMFIDCVYLNYPEKDIQVLSRLLNLIGTCVNISETPTYKEMKNAVVFPYIGTHSELFAKEIKRLIDDSPHFSMLLYINVLKHIRTPFVKQVLARQILIRINGGKIKHPPEKDTTVHTLLLSLNNKEWLGMNVRGSNPELEEDLERYPVMPKKPTRKTAFEVFQDDFLFIQLMELQGHMEVYRTHDLFNALRLPLEPSVTPKDEIELFSHFNIDLLQNLRKRTSKDSGISDQLPKNEASKLTFQSIVIGTNEILSYRELLKFCYHLQRFLNKTITKYPELAPIHNYLEEIFHK